MQNSRTPTHKARFPVSSGNNRYLCDYKPLLTVEPVEPAAQGIF